MFRSGVYLWKCVVEVAAVPDCCDLQWSLFLFLWFAVEDIKCKFKNLLTVFNWEYKAVQASKASDKPYVSKWKHYQQLLFLCQSCEEDSSADDVQILMVQESKDVKPGKHAPPSSLRLIYSCVLSSCTWSSSSQFLLLLTAEKVKASPQAASPSRCPSDRVPCGNRSLLSADPRCLWSEAKTQQLISFYSGRCQQSTWWVLQKTNLQHPL